MEEGSGHKIFNLSCLVPILLQITSLAANLMFPDGLARWAQLIFIFSVDFCRKGDMAEIEAQLPEIRRQLSQCQDDLDAVMCLGRLMPCNMPCI